MSELPHQEGRRKIEVNSHYTVYTEPFLDELVTIAEIPGGPTFKIYEDGTKIWIYQDGRQDTFYPNGQTITDIPGEPTILTPED